MFATIEVQKPGCGRPVLPSASSEALGQVPGGSGLGVNAEDHGLGQCDGRFYIYCWRRRVAIRKGFRKKWAIWDQEKTASFLYPWVGMENGKITRLKCPGRHPEKT